MNKIRTYQQNGPCHGLYFSKGTKDMPHSRCDTCSQGAVIEQEEEKEDGVYMPIYYASCKLCNIGKMFTQFEMEALAV